MGLKKCRGLGVAFGYGCGKLVEGDQRKYGLGLYCCFNDWLFNSDSGKEKYEKLSLNNYQEKEKSSNLIPKKENNSLSLGKILEETRNIVHRYIRLRDTGKPCISCNRPWDSTFEAGHFFKSELYSLLRFSEINIHGQCHECNCMKDGNIREYRPNLIMKVGLEIYEEMNNIALQNKALLHKWDREELLQIQKSFKNKIKELENG